MAIKRYIQGESLKKDQELFGLIGHWLVNQKVHDELGTSVTSIEGDFWAVSITGKGEVRGFANARAMKNGNLHIRYVYCADTKGMAKKVLIHHMLKRAEESQCQQVWTNDRENSLLWSEFGFYFSPRARGTFGRWNKELEENKS